ncbi:FecR family protein [Pedobacter caeni]|uniref:FecR family protein n=1 Tax=Pedobacter caeni TaxID=288992 RepID=A0A1M5HWC1_9SPHI|nr:FecR family protein [Pedobacter caeni]SHG20261.1 FecR family protein [Pedobacter caeni]
MDDSKENKRYQELASKWLDKTITAEEEVEFANWYNRDQNLDLEIPETFVNNEDWHKSRMFKKIQQEIRQEKPFFIRYRIAIAAILLISLSFGLFFYRYASTSKDQPQDIAKLDILPGSNKAFLTLADGTKLSLTDTKSGKLIEQAGVKISKGKDAQLIYTVMPSAGTKLEYNTISTPRAGQYQVNLPDGTKVWLNAASSLKFPTNFSASNERRVELIGEAYFEVAKDPKKAFVVSSAGQEVSVLGTHFNINSYPDEQNTYTTLLEGSIVVNGTRLRPDQQSVLNGKNIKVVPADIENVMAWKMGNFRFDDESLESIMKKVSRWYDVEIEFQNEDLKELEFGGIVKRSEKVSQVLKMLEMTKELSFKLEGRKIIIGHKK